MASYAPLTKKPESKAPEPAPKKPTNLLPRRRSLSATETPFPGWPTTGYRPRGEPLDPATRTFFEGRLGAYVASHGVSVSPVERAPSALPVTQPGDDHERTADLVSRALLSAPITSGGRPEARYDLAEVRIHTGAAAAESAHTLNAAAYTIGRDIVFGAGQYAPGEPAGRRLLAHELAHVAQQFGQTGPDAAMPAAPVLARQALGTDTVDIDLETPTPAQQAALREKGVQLPSVSPASTDPRRHSDYIDQRIEAVGFGIHVGGYLLFCRGCREPLFVPDRMVDLARANGTPNNASIYPSYDVALADIPMGPPAPGQGIPYGYFRADGVIVPTLFSPASTPRTVQTMLQARRELAATVQRELAVLALSLLGGRLLSKIYSRLVRIGTSAETPHPFAATTRRTAPAQQRAPEPESLKPTQEAPVARSNATPSSERVPLGGQDGQVDSQAKAPVPASANTKAHEKLAGKIDEKDFLLGPNPTGPEAFKKTAQIPGTQEEKAAYFDRLALELRQRTGWNATRTGDATDGSIVYHGEAQAKALVIRPDGAVFTGSWGVNAKLTVLNGRPALVVDWSLAGWKQW